MPTGSRPSHGTLTVIFDSAGQVLLNRRPWTLGRNSVIRAMVGASPSWCRPAESERVVVDPDLPAPILTCRRQSAMRRATAGRMCDAWMAGAAVAMREAMNVATIKMANCRNGTVNLVPVPKLPLSTS